MNAGGASEDEIAAEAPPKKLDVKTYQKTSKLDYVSRGCCLSGAQNVFMPLGKCIIREGAVVRGDVAKISLGRCCYVSAGVVLHPPSSSFAWGIGFLPLTVGDFVSFGEGCVVRAASVGSCVRVGANVVLGERCILRDNCEVVADSVVPPDTVLAPFTRWGGNPCRMLAALPDSASRTFEFAAEELYASLAP